MEQSENRITVTTYRPTHCYKCGALIEGDAYRTMREYSMKHLRYKKYYCSEKCARYDFTRDKAWRLDRSFSYTDKQWARIMSTKLEPVFIVRKRS